MALLNSSGFIYAGRSSRSLGLMMGWFDGDRDTEHATGLGVDLVTSDANLARSRINNYGGVMSEPLQFSFAIIKANRTDITEQESRVINMWLSGSKLYQKLYFESDSNVYFKAVCTEITDVCYYGLNGKKVVFTCDSGFAYSNEINHTLKVEGEKTIKLFNSSDDGVYYPTLEIESDGEVTVENIDDGESFTVDLSKVDGTVVIDCENSRVVDGDGKLVPVYKIGWGEMEHIYWFRLVDGGNSVKITGDCTFTIRCSFPRKVGVI